MENRLTTENIVNQYLYTAKFCMWFLLGYGAMQVLGVKMEFDELSILEKDTYRAHAQAEFNTWSDLDRKTNDDEALDKLSKIDNRRVRITGDTVTANWLWGIGVVLFFFISLFEIIYPAFK